MKSSTRPRKPSVGGGGKLGACGPAKKAEPAKLAQPMKKLTARKPVRTVKV